MMREIGDEVKPLPAQITLVLLLKDIMVADSLMRLDLSQFLKLLQTQPALVRSHCTLVFTPCPLRRRLAVPSEGRLALGILRQVLYEVRLGREHTSTMEARVGFGTVDRLMLALVVAITEGLPADGTLEGLLAAVYALPVPFEVALTSEGLMAVHALERALVGVGTTVTH